MCVCVREREREREKGVHVHWPLFQRTHTPPHTHTHTHTHTHQELQVQLETALEEVDQLREARERQKEMVTAVVTQRDMYRTLLAQSIPLPSETTQTPGSKFTSMMTTPSGEADSVATAATPGNRNDSETTEALRELKELKEQFSVYRREKRENDGIVGRQMETLRQEASALRMDNVKIAAKVSVWRGESCEGGRAVRVGEM